MTRCGARRSGSTSRAPRSMPGRSRSNLNFSGRNDYAELGSLERDRLFRLQLRCVPHLEGGTTSCLPPEILRRTNIMRWRSAADFSVFSGESRRSWCWFVRSAAPSSFSNGTTRSRCRLFDSRYRDAVAELGAVSGRDVPDKLAAAGFTAVEAGGSKRRPSPKPNS